MSQLFLQLKTNDTNEINLLLVKAFNLIEEGFKLNFNHYASSYATVEDYFLSFSRKFPEYAYLYDWYIANAKPILHLICEESNHLKNKDAAIVKSTLLHEIHLLETVSLQSSSPVDFLYDVSDFFKALYTLYEY